MIQPSKTPMTSTSGGTKSVSSHLFNSNVRIRNPPYVFPSEVTKTTDKNDTTLAQNRYLSAPHLNHKNHAIPAVSKESAQQPPLTNNSNGLPPRRYIDYKEFSRSLTAALFNGFDDPASFQCSMSQASHSMYAFDKQRESRFHVIDQYRLEDEAEDKRELQKNTMKQNDTSVEKIPEKVPSSVPRRRSKTAECHKEVTQKRGIRKDPFVAYRRRFDPMLKQEERIYNQDQLMKSLK